MGTDDNRKIVSEKPLHDRLVDLMWELLQTATYSQICGALDEAGRMYERANPSRDPQWTVGGPNAYHPKWVKEKV